ncbi:MAG: hypothetical protein ACM3QW_04485 [Ignavibacteriales bacterium]
MRKFYITDFYNEILRDIGEGKYWFAVEERVRKEYPNPDKILEFLTADHIPLGFDAANQTLFTRAALCDFAPVFPLFASKDEAREMMGDLISFYANLHWREFMSELKNRGKTAIFKEFCIEALKLAEEKGWREAEVTFQVDEFKFDRTDMCFTGTLREIEEFIFNGEEFNYVINTYLSPAVRVQVVDDGTIEFKPFIRTIPDIQGTAYLKRIS